MKKRVLALLLALVMLLALAACGGDDTQPANDGGNQPAASNGDSSSSDSPVEVQPATPADGGDQEPVTLTAWYYYDAGVEAGYQAWADAVHETYPWITVALEELPYDSGPEKFTVAFATDTTPDMYFDGYSRISAAVHGGITMDLTDVLADRADLFNGEITDGVIDGKNQYIPMWDGGGYVWAVNLDLAEELGVKDMLPADWSQWSYDDALEIMRAAKAANPDIYPTALWAGSKSSDAAYYNLLVAAGAKICNDDLTATAVNGPEALEALNFLKTIVDEELTRPGYITTIDEELYDPWNSGKLLFRFSAGFSNVGQFEQDLADGIRADFDYDFYAAPTPKGDHVPNGVSWGTYGVCAFPHDGNEEAVKLALGLFLDEPSFQNTILTAWGKFSRMTNTTIEFPSERAQKLADRGAEYSAYTISNFGILEGWWTDFRDTFYPQLQDFYSGKIDAQTVLDNWSANADAVIAAAQ